MRTSSNTEPVGEAAAAEPVGEAAEKAAPEVVAEAHDPTSTLTAASMVVGKARAAAVLPGGASAEPARNANSSRAKPVPVALDGLCIGTPLVTLAMTEAIQARNQSLQARLAEGDGDGGGGVETRDVTLDRFQPRLQLLDGGSRLVATRHDGQPLYPSTEAAAAMANADRGAHLASADIEPGAFMTRYKAEVAEAVEAARLAAVAEEARVNWKPYVMQAPCLTPNDEENDDRGPDKARSPTAVYTLAMTSDAATFTATIRGGHGNQKLAETRKRHGLKSMDGVMDLARKPSDAEYEAVRGRLTSALEAMAEDTDVRIWLEAEYGNPIS